ncbi:hypothetical protein BDV12DRAFT_176476 [Aspergillus spectabilis]
MASPPPVVRQKAVRKTPSAPIQRSSPVKSVPNVKEKAQGLKEQRQTPDRDASVSDMAASGSGSGSGTGPMSVMDRAKDAASHLKGSARGVRDKIRVPDLGQVNKEDVKGLQDHEETDDLSEPAEDADVPHLDVQDVQDVGGQDIGGQDIGAQDVDVPEAGVELPDGIPLDLSALEGLEVGGGGEIVDNTGNVIGKVVDGDAEDLVGHTVGGDGEIVDEDGDLIGRVDLVSQEPPDVAEEGVETGDQGVPLNNMEGLPVTGDEDIKDETGHVAEAVQNKALEGKEDLEGQEGLGIEEELPVTDDDNIKDEAGRVAEVAQNDVPSDQEGLQDQEQLGLEEGLPDISTLEGLKCNKLGSIVTADGTPVGELVEGDAKKLARGGFQLDNQGQFWDHQGHIVGKARPIPIEEEQPGPFADIGDIFVADDGWVQDEIGTRVGKVVEGDAKKLVGRAVDDDGDILDKRGNVIGRAEPYEQPEEQEEQEEAEDDLSILEGKTVNKLGNILDDNGAIIGKITDGNVKKLAGKKVDGHGQVWSDSGKVIGQAELIPQEEREKPEGIFYGFDGLTVGKEGMIMDATGEVIGRLVEGDQQRLQGRAVDEDGEIIDKLGNVIGRAERWSEPDLSPEELEKQQKEKEDADLAKNMSVIVQQTLDSVGPLCRQITQHIEKANQTPKEDLDEEQLVKEVKPLIEEAGQALQECKGALRALDPDGHIAETAKARSASREATPAEYQLAELLKELTQTVVETIDNGRRLIADMPHAKEKINPLWALLSEPLFQIIAAVGLLLSGVLGLVSKLLDGLGLGGLLRGLLGGLGLDKLLEGFGLGTVTEALGLDGKK